MCRIILDFIFLLSIVATAEAINKALFRACKDTRFCREHRYNLSQPHSQTYKIQRDSIKKLDSGTWSAKLLPPNQKPLILQIMAFDTGAIRIVASSLSKRWQPTEILLPGGLVSTIIKILSPDDAFQQLHKRPCKSTDCVSLSVEFFGSDRASHHHIIVVYFDPFRIDTFVDGINVSVINGNKFLYYENGDIHGEEVFRKFVDPKPKGDTSVGIDIVFPFSNNVYGIPEHTSPLSLPITNNAHIGYNEPYRLYNLDSFRYEVNETMSLYGNIPFILAHGRVGRKGISCGMFWFNPSETFVDVIENQKHKDIFWLSESGYIDLFLFPGPSPKDVNVQFVKLVGKQQMPPMFALGYHQSRCTYLNQDDILSVENKFLEYDLPVDVLWFDIGHLDEMKYFTWDKSLFPKPQEIQEKFYANGRRVVTIVNPHIKRNDSYYIHKQAARNNLYVKTPNGEDFIGQCWPGNSSYLDFTNSVVRKWWKEQFLLSNYIDSTSSLYIWNDMNEPAVFRNVEGSMPKNTLSLDEVEHREWHNVYGYFMHMASSSGLTRRSEVDGTRNRPFVLSRSFWAGSQRFGAVWTGDNSAEWSHLQISVPMMLSISLSGISFCGADVGGFYGNPDSELFIRWYQAAAFMPFFRNHAHRDTQRREPWLFGSDAFVILRAITLLRYSLLPYWYSVFRESHSNGFPVMRTLFTEFPDDELTYSIDNSWMIGDAILVAPALSPGVRSLEIYFPGNSIWYDIYTLGLVSLDKKRTIAWNTPLEYIPVFLRGGKIICRKLKPRQSTMTMFEHPLSIFVALDSNNEAKGEIYMDDEVSSDFETSNEYILRKFVFRKGKLSSLVDQSSGNFHPVNKIDKIVIGGLHSHPKSVVVMSNGKERFAIFHIESGVLVIKHLFLSIDEDWQIVLK